jgi:hypothetical protein
MGDGMISAIEILGFLMEVQEGRKGQTRAHSLICSLGEFERELGGFGHMLSWREPSGFGPCLFVEELPQLRRAHQ